MLPENTTSSPATAPAADSTAIATPWDHLDEAGTGLSVDDFLTTTINLASNALRRTITLPYAEQFGLTMPEWRIVSVVAHAGTVPFSDLVVRSATNKGQLSRTVRTLEDRGLLGVRNQANAGKKIECYLTPAGQALYAQVMPVARRAQATILRELDAQQRRALYAALQKLRELCGSAAPVDGD